MACGDRRRVRGWVVRALIAMLLVGALLPGAVVAAGEEPGAATEAAAAEGTPAEAEVSTEGAGDDGPAGPSDDGSSFVSTDGEQGLDLDGDQDGATGGEGEEAYVQEGGPDVAAGEPVTAEDMEADSESYAADEGEAADSEEPSLSEMAGGSCMLSFSQPNIDKVGKQSANSQACMCYSYAYGMTITTGRVHYWSEFNAGGATEDKASGYCSNYTAESYSTTQATLHRVYDCINAGKPCVLHVQQHWPSNSGQHWVLIVGYQNVTNADSLSTSNFLMLDPYRGAPSTPIPLNQYGYTVINGSRNVRVSNTSVATYGSDSTAPTVANVRVTASTPTSYTVACDVSDNTGVTSVAFPTWTTNNGQDDLVWHAGTINGGTATCTINISDHGNQTNCKYITDVYAYDAAGNSSSYGRIGVEMGTKMSKGYDRVLPDGDYVIALTSYLNGPTNYFMDIVGIDVPAPSGTNVRIYGTTTPLALRPGHDVWTITYSGGFYTIRQKDTGMYLDVAAAGLASGTNVQVWPGNGNAAQQWAISRNGDGYRIESRCNGLSIDNYGTNVRVFSDNNGTAQRWSFVPLGEVHTSYRAGVQGSTSWQGWKADGAQAGTTGSSLRLEGLQLRLSGAPRAGGIEYRSHIQGSGWESSWRRDGQTSGFAPRASGGLRLEAVQIRLWGDMAELYDVYYRLHVQRFGWMGWAKNGEEAGSAGYRFRVESIQVVIVPKGQALPASVSSPACRTEEPFVCSWMKTSTYVQGQGWQADTGEGDMAGTQGRGLRVEGLRIGFASSLPSGYRGSHVQYRAHVQGVGWQSWVQDYADAGLPGKGRRVEAIQIRLTGTLASDYDIWYRVQVQNLGWMGWAKNGESAGTSGYGYRVEAIQICLMPKGAGSPCGADTVSIYSNRFSIKADYICRHCPIRTSAAYREK